MHRRRNHRFGESVADWKIAVAAVAAEDRLPGDGLGIVDAGFDAPCGQPHSELLAGYPQNFRFKTNRENFEGVADAAVNETNLDAGQTGQAAGQIGGVAPATIFNDSSKFARSTDIVRQTMFLDLISYHSCDILAKVDGATMAVGLEARVPILDHRIVEFGFRLPLSVKVRQRQGKWILRQVLYRLVPQSLVERPKMGFNVPIDMWLRGPLREWAEELLREDRFKIDSRRKCF